MFSSEINRSNQEVTIVDANIKGLKPGKHGLNVHEVGDVTCDDGKCTGASYNPEDRPHGGPNSVKKFGASACHYVGDGCLLWRHIGDLGNLSADDAGVVETKFKDQYVSLGKKEASIVGRSVVIHAGADDFTTTPDDGDAGPIVAYATIRPQ